MGSVGVSEEARLGVMAHIGWALRTIGRRMIRMRQHPNRRALDGKTAECE